MDKLKPNAKALLDQARGAVAPSSHDVAALRERLGLASPPPPNAPESAPSPANLLRRAMLGGLAAAAVGAATLAATAPPDPVRLNPIATFVPEPPSVATQPPPPPIPPRAAKAPPPAVQSPSPTDPPPAARPRRTTRPAPVAPAQGANLQAELTLIIKARRALAAGDDAVARSAAQKYTQTFAHGAFVEEAQVLDVIASCNLGRTQSTTQRATSYAERGTASFAQRVRKACLEPDD